MATETINYGLKKPDAEDFYNVEDFNENSDKVDAALQELKEARPDWNEFDPESLSHIKNLPLSKTLYHGNFDSTGPIKLTTSAAAYRYIEFEGTDENGAWSETVNADRYIGNEFKLHGFTFPTGFSSGPELAVGQRYGGGIIQEIIGHSPKTSRIG